MTNIQPQLRAARAAVKEFTALVRSIEDEHAAAHRERRRLLDRVPPKDELKAAAHAYVDREAEAFVAKEGYGIVSAFAGRVEERKDGAVRIWPAKGPNFAF